jgi:hypothetical protein
VQEELEEEEEDLPPTAHVGDHVLRKVPLAATAIMVSMIMMMRRIWIFLVRKI